MPTRVDDLEVHEGHDVFLTVLIGEGQLGFTTALLGEEKKTARRDVRRLPLGPAAELRGRVLVVSTTVTDIQKEHDRTSVTVVLGNGGEHEFPQSEAAHPSGVVNYLNVITFV